MAARRSPSTAPHPLDERALLCAALARFHAFAEALPPALAETWLDVETRVLRRIGTWEDHFLGPLGTPAFVLIAGVAELLGLARAEEPALLDASEAMVCAYLAVRIQDDRIDEDVPPTWSFLEHLLLAREAGLLLAAARGDPRFLDRWQAQVAAFGEAATVDDGLRATPSEPWKPDAVRVQGAKFLPMLAPLAALCWCAGRPELEAELTRVIEDLGIALQLANDLLNAPADLAAARGSPCLRRLGLVPGLARLPELHAARIAALAEGSLHLYLSEIGLHLRLAGERLALLGSTRLALHAEPAAAAIRERAFALTVRALIAGKQP